MERRCRWILACLVIATAGLPGTLRGQETEVLTDRELDELVREEVSRRAADRADVRAFLAHPDVEAAAEAAGLDIRRIRRGAATLGDAETEDLARRVRDLRAGLVGGDQIVVSTTTVIIALLVLILILVAAD